MRWTILWLIVPLPLTAVAQNPNCPKGYQPFAQRCVTQRMSDYIACVEASGGNHEEITEEVADVANKQASVGVHGAGSGVVAKGSGSVVLNKKSESELIKTFQSKYYAGAMAECRKVLDQNASPNPHKRSHSQSSSPKGSQLDSDERLPP